MWGSSWLFERDGGGLLTISGPRKVPWEEMWCMASRTLSRENTVRMDVSRVCGLSLSSRGFRNLMLKCSNLQRNVTYHSECRGGIGIE